MTQQTSIDSYAAIKASGVLNELQLKVYEVVKNNGPITQGETWSEHFSDVQRHTVTPRFAELVKLGLLKATGTRKDRLSGVETMTWAVTGELPKQAVKRLTKDQQVERVRKFLLDIHWRVKNNVPVDLPTFETESKRLLELLKTGVDPKESDNA